MTANKPNTGESHNSVPYDIDELVTAIQNDRRRLVLLFADEFATPISAGDLAEAIAVLENGQNKSELNAQDRKRVYISLTQCHLDTLDDLGAVVYDDRSKQIWPTGATPTLVSVIRHLQLTSMTDGY